VQPVNSKYTESWFITPFAMNVLITPIPVDSANFRNSPDAPNLMVPLPARITGLFAWRIT
jgi:hypothetical protein